MIPATLVGHQPQSAPHVVLPRSRSTEMHHRRQILFLPERHGAVEPVSQGVGYGAVQVGRRQFDGMAGTTRL